LLTIPRRSGPTLAAERQLKMMHGAHAGSPRAGGQTPVSRQLIARPPKSGFEQGVPQETQSHDDRKNGASKESWNERFSSKGLEQSKSTNV
jgi:hypothetical protein